MAGGQRKVHARQADPLAVNKLMAMLVASAAGLFLRDPLDGLFGVGLGEALGLVLAALIYFFANRLLKDLRGE